jgi:Zn ribbon nucleic-acid-binding protein
MVHTDFAECEACNKTGSVEIYSVADIKMALCVECTEKEKNHQSPEKQQERLNAEKERVRILESSRVVNQPVLSPTAIIDKARAIDYTVQVKSDVFNAETLSLQEVWQGIQSDSNIPQTEKQFAYAKYTQERIEHLQRAIFEEMQSVNEKQNRIRVLQSELNQIVARLREEERARLRALTPEYKPRNLEKPLRPKTEKPVTVPKKKFDKKELLEVTAKLQAEGLPVQWHMLQQTCVARNMTPNEAADVMRKVLGGK